MNAKLREKRTEDIFKTIMTGIFQKGSRVGGLEAHFQRTQLDNYQITVNTLETNVKNYRTNSTTKGIEEATLKKTGSVESWSRGEIYYKYCRGKIVIIVEKGERDRSTQGNKENISPKPLPWKMRRTEFFEFLQAAGLKGLGSKGWQAWLG